MQLNGITLSAPARTIPIHPQRIRANEAQKIKATTQKEQR